jgi:PAS domain S-box-containing protein
VGKVAINLDPIWNAVRSCGNEASAAVRVEEILAAHARLVEFRAVVGVALTRENNLGVALQRCTEAMVQHLNAAFARIWTLNQEQAVLELQASAGLYTHLNGSHSRVPVGQLKIGLIAQERKPHLTNMVIVDPRISDQAWAKREGMVAFAGYPLLVEDQLVGVMAMFARQPLPDSTLTVLASVANEIALGIKRKRAEERVRENEQRLRRYFDLGLIGMVITAPTHGFLEVNDQVCRILGYERSELLHKTWVELTHPDDLAADVSHFNRVLAGEYDGYSIDKRFIHKDGDVIYATISTNCLRRADGSIDCFVALLQDISERKRDEEEKQKLQGQLFQAQKLEAVGTLAGGVAHDFNNLLTIILGFSELLKKAVLTDTVAQSNLEEIVKAGNRAKELVQQLLAFSRPGPQTQCPQALHVIVAESLRLLQAVLPSTIEVCSHLDSSGDVVFVNATQMQQVIMNLGMNALHAMQHTGGVLEVRLEPLVITNAFASAHPTLRPGLYSKLQMRDTGCGMTPEVMSRIFDPFFTTKPVGEGSGLGLSVVHGIVSSHGGSITVESTPGQGTIFAVYLPQMTDALAATRPSDVSICNEDTGCVGLFGDDEEGRVQMARQRTSAQYR